MEKLTFASFDVEEMTNSARAILETYLGRKIGDADPLFLLIKSFLAIIVHQRAIIDEAANQNLLYYATEKNLEALGELVGVKRNLAAPASCTVRLTLSAPRLKATNIPAGIRINAGDNVHFYLSEDVTFLTGETETTAHALCQQVGEIGNGYHIGEINNIVDPQPYLSSIENITASEGGADIESDDSLRERIREAPESFSVAGSRGAYEFWTKTFSAEIIDALAVSPEPGKVDVYFLLKGGEIPHEEMLNQVRDYLSADEIRPLTDFVTVKPPETVEYEIEAEYYISRENQTQALEIQAAVEKAVQEFILWQKSKLGVDVSPTELYYRLRAAGADRVEVIQPKFQEVPNIGVAVCKSCNVAYKGLKSP